MSLDQVTKFITDKNQQIGELFKEFCQATPNSTEKQALSERLSAAKSQLNNLLAKEKQIKIEFAKRKRQRRLPNSC